MDQLSRIDFTPEGERTGQIGKRYDDIAREIRQDYAVFIASVAGQMDSPLDWWLDGPATRNPIFSDLYHEVVCLLLLEQLSKEGKPPETVVVSHGAFAEAVRAVTSRHGHTVVCELPSLARRLNQRFRALLSPWRSSLHLLMEWSIVRLSGRRGNTGNEEIALIDTFAIPGYITEDRYYPGLLAFDEAGMPDFRFVPQFFNLSPAALWQAARALRRNPERYLIKEDWVRLRDLLWSMGHLFRLPVSTSFSARFGSIDLAPLILADLKKRRGNRCAMRGLLNYRFAASLARRGVRLSRIVDWFENHPMDRGWNAGFNRWYPGTPRSGYVGFFPAGQSYRPTQGEADAGLLPPTFNVLGEGFRRDLGEFLPNAHITVAPAFRYPQFAGNDPEFRANRLQDVLIALPYYPRMCDQVITIVAAIQDRLELPILLKPHPAHPLDRIAGAENVIRNGAKIAAGSLADALQDAAVMITGAQASTIIEAAAMAVPTVVVAGRGEVAEVAIPEALPKSLYGICYDASGAEALLSGFLQPDHQSRRYEDAAQFRERCFTAVSEQNVRLMLAA